MLVIYISGKGISSNANESLRFAYEFNSYVIPYLIGAKKIPAELPEYMGIGDEDEAIYCAVDSISLWKQTEGALKWIEEFYIEQSFHEHFK